MTAELNTTDNLIKSLGNNPLRLNIGCGDNKIEGFINIDSFAEAKPDLVHDIRKASLPFKDSTVEEICFFHCIEHIEEKYHEVVLEEFYRVLSPGGRLVLSYPEFLKCVKCYETNYKGQREFFKATIFGRQSHDGDYHVALMDTPFFLNKLKRVGFNPTKVTQEPNDAYYTIVLCIKGQAFTTREELLRNEIFNS